MRGRRRVYLKPLRELYSELSEDPKHARQRAARELLPPMTADDFKAIGKDLVAHLSDGHVGEADVEPLASSPPFARPLSNQ